MFWLGFFTGILVATVGAIVFVNRMNSRILAQATRIKKAQRDRRSSMRRYRL